MIFSFKTLCIAVTIAAVAARTTWKQLDNYDFHDYIKEFGHKWEKGSPEFLKRQIIFTEELARVRAHNAKKLSWKEGVNFMSAMTLEEKKAYMGFHKGAHHHHKPKNLKPFDLHLKSLKDLPEEIDWREKEVVSPVKDQGQCGSCWAFASTATIESHVALNSGLLFDLSPQQIASCAPNPDQCGGTGGCYGATAEIAFDYIAGSAGMVQEFQMPYYSYFGDAHDCNVPSGAKATVDGYVKLPENNYTALMNAVATVGPMAISVDATGWGAYESGVYQIWNQNAPVINHAVVLVGYGVANDGYEIDGEQKYWTIRNSWSPSWGEEGYIRLARSDDDEDNCGMDTEPQTGTACAGETDPVKVCGTAGVLYDSSYPTGAKAL